MVSSSWREERREGGSEGGRARRTGGREGEERRRGERREKDAKTAGDNKEKADTHTPHPALTVFPGILLAVVIKNHCGTLI